MNQKNLLFENTIIIMIGKISSQILSYVLLPLFTTRMAVAEYGKYDFGNTISLFMAPVITLLMEESMFRFLIDAENDSDRKKIITQTIYYSLFSTLIFIPIIALVMHFSSYPLSFNIALMIFIISNVCISISNAFARGIGHIKLYSLSNLLLGMGTLFLTILVLIFRPNAVGLLYANSIANLACSAFLCIKLKLHKYVGAYNKQTMKEMVKFSAPLVPNSVSWTIINMSDRIILTNFVGSWANGIYAMANKFPNVINVLYGYFYQAWKESAARIYKEEDKEAYYDSIYRDIKRFLFAITVCMIAVLPFAFPILIKSDYRECYVYMPIIMIATYFANLSSFYGGIFSAFKETKIMGITTFIAALINLVIDLVFVKRFEIFAACFSTLVADVLIYFYRKNKLKQYMKLKEVKWLGPTIVMTLVVIGYYLRDVFHASNVVYYVFNTFTLILAVSYSIANNYRFMKSIMNKVTGKAKQMIKRRG